MATINTDIAQKIDIVARQFDTFTIKLDMTKQDGTVYPLDNTYIVLNIYNPETEGSVLYLSNHDTGYPQGGAVGNLVTLYDKFTTDTYTVEDKDAISFVSDTGVITINQLQLNIAPGSYKYKMILQTTTSIKTWMYGKFKVNE
tara:strand:- start:192 stop:620 length:429 start_codon:yes stop_codon:yes gene_type:complete